MKTFSAKPAEVQHEWFLVDANDKTLGRLASEIAKRLRGKHKPIYTPHIDTGDYIVVINADKVRVTGNKLKDKIYYKHTGYIGHPEEVLKLAVKGMMPRGPLGRAMMTKLKIFAGAEHAHTAQQPKPLEL